MDDSLHSNSKIRKVAAKCPAALALWVIAGSFSADKLLDGFVPDDDLPWLLPGGETLAAELVAARLWRRVKGGHQFHDWADYNRLKDQVLKDREEAKERMRKLRSGEVRPNKQRTGGARSRPRPEVPNGTSPGGHARCPHHPTEPVDICGTCRSERLGAV